MRQLLSDMGKEQVEEIYNAANQVIDEVYFDNADLRTLDLVDRLQKYLNEYRYDVENIVDLGAEYEDRK